MSNLIQIAGEDLRDTRLRVAGMLSKKGTATAVAAWIFLVDAAGEDRNISNVRTLNIDVALDLPVETTDAIVAALKDVGMISADGTIIDMETAAHPSTPPTGNAPAAPSGGRSKNAERQRRYRERKKEALKAAHGDTVTHNVTRNVTHNVTRNVTDRNENVTQDVGSRARAVSIESNIYKYKEESHPSHEEESVDLEIARVLNAAPCVMERPIDDGDITLSQIWDAYPETHRGSWKDAEREWHFVKRDRSVRRKGLWDVLDGIERWRASRQWANGYIPMLGNFLRKHAWLVTPPPAPKKTEAERRAEAMRVFDQAAKAGALDYTQEELDAYDAMLREQERTRKQEALYAD